MGGPRQRALHALGLHVSGRSRLRAAIGFTLPPRRVRVCCACTCTPCAAAPRLPSSPVLPTLPPLPSLPLSRSFEALCTGQAVADATSEFGVLLRGRLGRHRLFMGAEVDCYDPSRWQPPAAPGAAVASGGGGGGAAVQPGPAAAAAQQGELPPLEALLELKTYKLPQHAGQQRSVHRWKHPKWWLQSFLAGVPRLALGTRDDQVHGGGLCTGACARCVCLQGREGLRMATPTAACWAPPPRVCVAPPTAPCLRLPCRPATSCSRDLAAAFPSLAHPHRLLAVRPPISVTLQAELLLC